MGAHEPLARLTSASGLKQLYEEELRKAEEDREALETVLHEEREEYEEEEYAGLEEYEEYEEAPTGRPCTTG